MGYLSRDQIINAGFKKIGVNVKISDKATIYDCGKIEIGDNSRIDDFCVISGRVVIGRFCHITPMCLIAGGEPGIYMADFVTLAYGVKIFSQSDDYTGKSLTNSLIRKEYKNEIFQKVIINKQVIIGANSTIMPGVEIAEGCAIGAMSLVNKKTDDWGIYYGVPAKRAKDRLKDLIDLEKKFLGEQNDTF